MRRFVGAFLFFVTVIIANVGLTCFSIEACFRKDLGL